MKKFLLIIFIFFFNGCIKKKNLNLAKNFYEQSLIETEEKNYKNALQFIEKSLEIAPSAKASALKATLLFQIKEYDESLDLFKKIIDDKKTPANLKCDIMNNYACTMLTIGKNDEARKTWHKLTKEKNYFSPEVAWFNLGLLDFYNGLENSNKEQSIEKLKNSQKYFSKAIEISNEYVDAYFYLASALMNLKEYESAKKVVISLLTIEPLHEPAKFLLEEINIRLFNELNSITP